jgi:hypothetical protein
MTNCKNCIYWIDESLEQIEADPADHSHIFMGCRMMGSVDCCHAPESCRYYIASENLFTICHSCKLTVPKTCVSLGECANCTDTDLFCIDLCLGGENRKYCTHFIRLHTEGVHLIDNDRVFDLFPTIGMPGSQRPGGSVTDSSVIGKSEEPETVERQILKQPLTPATKNSRRRKAANPVNTSKRRR